MTVRELKQLLKGLPDDMPVVMILDDEAFITVCKEKSSVVTIMDEEEGETLLLLLPCGCDDEPELGEINSQPELN